MSKFNQYFKGKKVLDAMSESYADEVFETFETLRNMGFRFFHNRYYPTMVCSCTDKDETAFVANYSHGPSMKDYGMTKMIIEMGREFSPTGKIIVKDDLCHFSKCNFPVGQCAEQHAANNLLKILGNRLNIKKELFFGKPVRTATGEDNIPYCANCSKLFDL